MDETNTTKLVDGEHMKGKVKFTLPKSFYKAKWNDQLDLVFANCDVTLEMAIVIRDSIENDSVFTIKDVDSDGDIRLNEIPYTWPPELLKPIKEKK